MGHGAAYRGFAVPPESAWRLEIPSRSPSEPKARARAIAIDVLSS